MSQTNKTFITTRLVSHEIRQITIELNELALEAAGIAPTNSRIMRIIKKDRSLETTEQIMDRAKDSQYQIALRQVFDLLLQMKYSIQEYTDTIRTLRKQEQNVPDPD